MVSSFAEIHLVQLRKIFYSKQGYCINMKIEKNPICSVIMINWNSSELTLDAVESVINSEPKVNFEIIVIDNGSRDDEALILKRLLVEDRCVTRVIFLEENLGFSGGANYAIREARGDYYVLVNTDVEVQEGWLDFLFEKVNSESGIAAVSSNIIENGVEALTSQVKYLKHIHGCSVIIPKKAWEIIGEFDEVTFFPAYAEELDWSYRARNIGFKLLKSNKSIVIHQVGQTSEKNLSKKGIQRLRIFHRVLFRFINYNLHDWLSKALVLEFYSALKERNFLLLMKAYLYSLLKIRLIIKQRRIRSQNTLKGIKLLNK